LQGGPPRRIASQINFLLDRLHMFVNEEVSEHEKTTSLRRLIKSRDQADNAALLETGRFLSVP